MRKTATILTLGTSALVIAGCAVPVPVQVASWALDGISLLTTEKSVTDHGLSIVAEKDCAVWRGVTKGELCRDWDDGGTLVADRDTAAPAPRKPAITNAFAPPARSDIPPLNTDLDDSLPNITELTGFVTAAGPAPQTSSVTQPLRKVAAVRTAKLKPRPVAYKRPVRTPVAVASKKSTQVSPVMVKPYTPVRPTVTAPAEPAEGIYFVIGSFRNYANARGLAGQHGALVPAVLAAKLDGAPVYRVVVGPALPGREKALHRRVARAGLTDTWAIRVAPGDWTFAEAVIERKRRAGIGTELAGTLR